MPPEVIALSMAAETEEIERENRLFGAKLKECRSSIPNLISRRQFNDRRKSVSSLCEQIHSRIANHIDGNEDHFCIDSKPIEVWLVGKGTRWGGRVIFTKHWTLAVVPLKEGTTSTINSTYSVV